MGEKLGITLGDKYVVVTGSSGRLAGLLQKYWEIEPPEGLNVLWAGRTKDVDIFWDMMGDDQPLLPKGAVVLHLAGLIRGTVQELSQNAAMIKPLVEACQASQAKGILFASTAALYRQDGTLGQEEIVDPVNDYGRSKLEAEAELARLAHDLPYLSLRIGNVAGADALLGQDPSRMIQLDPVAGREGGAGTILDRADLFCQSFGMPDR